ncbi:hypothetical protein [Sphingobacterium yanglingense]|uniref:Uncharacterized protein n=1 Tax=Sphingobacterium yanglingense TaxID=1437280 RepID=A0A4R6WLF8_9SPHI|nr:hypothetical protein [Sphingobacterium yanglingense]TDQ79572.1 hypothetical protein CLV99_1017 [Sphingobacterium yanglingense]
MRPIHFPESNITFEKPTTTDDSECLPISAYVGQDIKGNPHINTVWQPSKEDIEAINAGRPIVVCVLGTALPPMSMFTYDEEGNSNE